MVTAALAGRIALVGAAAAALVAGLAGGLARFGLSPAPLAAVEFHGALMICGFFGTLIGLERAVADGRPTAFAVPALAAAGAGLLGAGMEAAGAAAFLLAGLGLTALTARAALRQPSLFAVVMTAGAALWPCGTAAWLAGAPAREASYPWLCFLVLTIAAERIELSRLRRPGRLAEVILAAVVAALLVALGFGEPWTGSILFAAALACLAAWLAVHDIALSTIRTHGLARFSAACLLCGYAWLAVAATSLVLLPPGSSAFGNDAALHAIGLGFVLSMVLAHAPIILPAVARLRVRYVPALYAPAATLQVAVALRIAGDFADAPALAASSAWLTVASLATYTAMLVATALCRPAAGAVTAAHEQGAYWLSGGFRPFFLLGALAMALSVLASVPALIGLYEIPTAFAPREWHVHSLLFGGVSAIIAGFALTAVSNWTGRPPIAGKPLLALVLLWAAGRVAVAASGYLGAIPAAAIDLLFLPALAVVLGREIVLAGDTRNLRVVGLIGLLAAADAAFHFEAIRTGTADDAARASVSTVLMLVMLVGGRIIPAFTRNWLAARGSAPPPAAFSAYDAATMAVSAAALAAWTVLPASAVTGWLALAAGALNAGRLARWCGLRTRSETLLAILHVGFATIPLGFALVGLSILAPAVADPISAVHVWSAGTVGVMTLAVMARAGRGHSGRPLAAGRLEIAMFALVLAGATARVLAPYAAGWTVLVLEFAGLAWAAAYLVFAASYAPMLLVRPQPRTA